MPAYAEASGKSCDSPPAPCTWIALSRIHCTVWGVAILIAWISVWAPRLPTVSISQAVLSTSSRSCSMRTRDSAIQSRTTPWLAIGRPNATRDAARLHISSMAASATPIERMQWWMRPGPRRAWAIAKPGTLLADQVGDRDADVGEAQLGVAAVLVVVVPEDLHAADDLEARGVARHQDLALLTVPRRGSGRSCPSRS